MQSVSVRLKIPPLLLVSNAPDMLLSDEGYSALIPIDQITPEAEAFIPAFTCGTISLDSFLKESALDMHRDYLSRTSLLFHEAFDGLVGYVTLANDSIPLTVVEISHMALNYNCTLPTFPAVKICRLAVNARLQNQQIGRRILDLVTGAIVDSATAARFLITDALDQPRVVKFYEDYGFTRSIWAADKHGKDRKHKGVATVKMIKDIYGEE